MGVAVSTKVCAVVLISLIAFNVYERLTNSPPPSGSSADLSLNLELDLKVDHEGQGSSLRLQLSSRFKGSTEVVPGQVTTGPGASLGDTKSLSERIPSQLQEWRLNSEGFLRQTTADQWLVIVGAVICTVSLARICCASNAFEEMLRGLEQAWNKIGDSSSEVMKSLKKLFVVEQDYDDKNENAGGEEKKKEKEEEKGPKPAEEELPLSVADLPRLLASLCPRATDGGRSPLGIPSTGQNYVDTLGPVAVVQGDPVYGGDAGRGGDGNAGGGVPGVAADSSDVLPFQWQPEWPVGLAPESGPKVARLRQTFAWRCPRYRNATRLMHSVRIGRISAR